MNGSSSNYKRTPIDQLIDLDSSSDSVQPSEPKFDPKFQKYLRGDVKSQFMNGANGGVEHFMPPPQAPQRPMYQPPQHQYDHDMGVLERYNPPPMAVQQTAVEPAQISCQDFYNHVKSCPICSRFYNNDRTMYIIIIVLLSIVSLILLKRVLEK